MCDTMCVVTADGVLFGKNSDREPAEAQAVELQPARSRLDGALRCTWLDVPQVAATRAVLLSRPVWMWGCEMGANDAGVVAGNEAVFTRQAVERSGLTGMDLQRLALERSGTAREALEVVTGLLARFPQGGGMGFGDRAFRYHSSFLFADAREAWVLETAGRFWAAEKVRGVRSISNALTIGAPDLVHPEAADEARRRGWLAKGAELDFAKCFADPLYRHLSGGPQRQACTSAALAGATDVARVKAVLRQHLGRHPASGLRLDMPCGHASWQPTRRAGQTTASMVSVLKPSGAQHWLTGTSAPCLSVFKPVSFEVATHELGPAPGERPDAESLFWRHEALHRAVLRSWDERRGCVEAERQALEARATDVRASWAEHREVVREWASRAAAIPARGGSPLFHLWWSRRPALPRT